MKAAVYEPGKGLQVRNVPAPEPGAGEVLVAVEACGVCGSDRQLVAGEPPPAGTRFPLIPGHEIAGRVADIGRPADAVRSSGDAGRSVGEAVQSPGEAVPSAVDGTGSDLRAAAGSERRWTAGEAVLVYPFIPCGRCRSCRAGQGNLCLHQEVVGFQRPGGFAEYVAVPAETLIPRPPGLAPEAAALLVDAFATPHHALTRVARVRPDESAVVIGTGGLGLAALALLRALGTERTGAVSARQEGAAAAARAGAAQTWVRMPDTARAAAREIRRWAEGGADVVLDTQGTAESLAFGAELLRPGGRLCVIGMSPEAPRLPPVAHLVRRGVALLGSYGSLVDDVRALVSLAAAGRLNPGVILAGVLPLDNIASAFSRGSAPSNLAAVSSLSASPVASAERLASGRWAIRP